MPDGSEREGIKDVITPQDILQQLLRSVASQVQCEDQIIEFPYIAAQVQRARAENVPIRIKLPDGSEKEGVKGVTTPQDILQQLPRSVAKKAVVAKVDGHVWDMFVPFEGDCDLQILTFEDPEGKEVLSHPRVWSPSSESLWPQKVFLAWC